MSLIAVILPAVTAFLGSWFAAQFALRRFYRERTWDRRADAYTAIFDALHDHQKWFTRHLDAEVKGLEISGVEVKKLTDEYAVAEANLQRRIASETWLISDDFRLRVEILDEDLSERITDWSEFLENGQETIERAIIDLREIARTDLFVR